MCTVTITYDNKDTVIADLIAKIKSRGAMVVTNDEVEYDPEFVAKIERGREQIAKGECVKIDIDNLWK